MHIADIVFLVLILVIGGIYVVMDVWCNKEVSDELNEPERPE